MVQMDFQSLHYVLLLSFLTLVLSHFLCLFAFGYMLYIFYSCNKIDSLKIKDNVKIVLP